MWSDLLGVSFSYLLGAIPFGLMLTWFFAHKDVRSVGSGNIGATNVVRAAGKKVGALVLLLDLLKGYVPVYLASRFFGEGVVPAACGLAAFLGHVFPIYLGFRGGKGVATALGVTLALVPAAALAGAGVFAACYALFRISSLGSLAASLAGTIVAWVLVENEAVRWMLVLMLLVIFARHAGNLRRLVRREEKKV